MSTHPCRCAVGLAAAALVATSFTPTLPATAAEPAPAVTIHIDPSYQQPEFEGWGTSLVWFANATGGYPEEIRTKLADMVFGADGLNLNIARYNIGGGNAPDVPAYLRPGGAVPGWWKAPAGTTRADVDWFDANDPANYDWNADANQRWWVDAVKDRVTRWEAFSNSPPWFMTNSGYVSGGFDANADQLKTSSIDSFTTYLVKVTEQLEQAHGITVDTIDPFNEPNTNYWGTRIDANGKPSASQEGAHMGPELQQKVIRSLHAQLAAADTGAVISAMDETNPSTFVRNWTSYPQDVKDMVGQMNVHTYGTGQRTSVRDLAKSDNKPLWMSEVEGSWGAGQDFTSMEPGIGMAQHITDDLRELEPAAWVFWQPVEDYDNMAPKDGYLGGNWGSIQIPFNCTAKDTSATCPIRTNQKFNTIRNFTHYIRPGDHLVKVDNTLATAAIRSQARSATVVYTNPASTAVKVTLDLSKFRQVGPKATVTPIVTDANGALVRRAPVRVRGDLATVEVPASSVTTLVTNDVRGVDAEASFLREGHVYRLTGVQSGRAMTAQEGGATIEDTAIADPDQLWRFHRLAGANSNRARYQVLSLDGRQLAVIDGKPVLQRRSNRPTDAATWFASTTGDGTWTLANAAIAVDLEVGGQKTAAGSPVTVWQPNSATNQLWRISDETVQSVPAVSLWTLPGRAPSMPATVPARYADGVRGALPVVWESIPPSRWRRVGIVTIRGTATDPTGRHFRVTARVYADTISRTRTAQTSTYMGGLPELPTTVPATTDRLRYSMQLPVTWSTAGANFDALGTVVVPGTATLPDGSKLPATLEVKVTPASEAVTPIQSISATFTEPGYSTAGLTNGNLTDKAWSNWVSGAQRPGDTFTVQLPIAKDVTRVKVYFYKDGGNVSYASTVHVEAMVDGTWQRVSGDVTTDAAGAAAPVFDLPLTQSVKTDQLRVVMTGRGYMTVAEVQVLAKAPSV